MANETVWLNGFINEIFNSQKERIKDIEKYIESLNKNLLCDHSIKKKKTNVTTYYCIKCNFSIKIPNHLDKIKL